MVVLRKGLVEGVWADKTHGKASILSGFFSSLEGSRQFQVP